MITEFSTLGANSLHFELNRLKNFFLKRSKYEIKDVVAFWKHGGKNGSEPTHLMISLSCRNSTESYYFKTYVTDLIADAAYILSIHYICNIISKTK